MKTELKDVSATRKDLSVEIPHTVVDAAVERTTRAYGRRARIPGFRPGKVPAGVIRSRFRDQILQDVAQDLIPRTVAEALSELGQHPLDTPTIRDISLKEGEPLSFLASFETLPPVDPGDYSSFTLRRRPATLEPGAVESAIARLRSAAARFEPVEDRAAESGDVLTVDVTRRPVTAATPGESHQNVTIEIGASGNPPGLDAEVTGMTVGASKQFTLSYPADYEQESLAGQQVAFDVTLHAIRLRVLPEIDDEFAKDVGEFDSLADLEARVTSDLQDRITADRDREVRAELLAQLARRIDIELPEILVTREVDRRVEEFVRHLVEQRVDPARANVDWDRFREQQKDAATDTVRATLALDEVARREQIAVSEADVEHELARYAERSGHTTAAVRARLEKDEGMARVREGMRREKVVDFLMSRATLVDA